MTFFFMPVSIRVKVRLLGFQDSQDFLTKFVPVSQQKYPQELVRTKTVNETKTPYQTLLTIPC